MGAKTPTALAEAHKTLATKPRAGAGPRPGSFHGYLQAQSADHPLGDLTGREVAVQVAGDHPLLPRRTEAHEHMSILVPLGVRKEAAFGFYPG